MKKRFITILSVWASAMLVWADPVDLTKAKSIASAYMSEGTVPEQVYCSASKRGTGVGQSPLYIFNRGNDQGFVIVSGDDCMPEILGYTESGDFDVDKLPPALLDWIEGYSQMIGKAQEVNAAARVVTRAANVKQDVAPLVTAHWSQGAPYNNLCPYRTDGGGRAITGCVATAASQVIYYWRKENPRKSLYATPTYSYGEAPVTESFPAGTPIKYELMQDNYTGTTPEDMNTAVATLMSIVGTSTWLTYGSSTSGQISNLVNTFWGQFHLNSVCTYKSGYTQESWENLIYEDLEKGWPIVYSGVSPTAGGHAVVIDGYRASDNLFHFNFGWGGSGDGYFTVNDTNGMNGFNGQQGMTHQIHPNVNLLEATLNVPSTMCTRMYNPVEVEVTNNGTVSYSGLYIVASKTETVPTGITSASSKDLTTVIPSGETSKIALRYRPLTPGTYHLYLLDGNAQVLDHATVDVMDQDAMLALEGVTVRNSLSGQESVTIDGRQTVIDCYEVYSEVAEIVADVLNPEKATASTNPLMQCGLYVYDAEQGVFVLQKTYTGDSDVVVSVGENADVAFQIAGLEKDKLYSAQILKEYRVAGNTVTMDTGACDTIVYFRMKGTDLEISETEDNGAIVSGHWNADRFKELAQSSTIAYYDLRSVEGLDSQPEAANPNALFYVGEDAKSDGYNIIKNGVCDDLRLTVGYDFYATEKFIARHAAFDPKTTSMKWEYIALPFACDVPSGSMARRITKLTSSLISGSDVINTRMESCIPYLYKTTRPGKDMLVAENVEVSVKPVLFSDTIKVTFTNIIGGENDRRLNKNDVQMFSSSKYVVIPAFSGYLEYAKDVETSIYAYNKQDQAAGALADMLGEAFEAEEKYEGKVPESIWDAFIESLSEAAVCYTIQADIAEVEEMTLTLGENLNSLKLNEIFAGIPIDLTECYLKDPSFESGRTTNWTITRATGQLSKIVKVSTLDEYMVNSDGTYVFYSYSTKGVGSVKISQTLTDLPDGLYRLTAKLATDEGQSVTLYANERTATMTDEGFGIRYLTETVIDNIEVRDGTLEIGIQGNDTEYKADDFRLYYVGALATDIAAVPATGEDIKVWGGEGIIHLFVPEGKPVAVSIYGMDGRLYKQMNVEGLSQVSRLPKGVYIVNKQKVIVK